jgi:hypothetical protein
VILEDRLAGNLVTNRAAGAAAGINVAHFSLLRKPCGQVNVRAADGESDKYGVIPVGDSYQESPS